ncbi:hypothetical protein OEZ85_007517 [Tetradesmus obliquus]|uniref:Metallo-beta-lactamase domain-containing protein n=1 Tax=Tetradesmus obliquus TaxID=3088 RepID=A0ABY8TGC7_TETOB|nr:hypothetical protein OEZ85_007517 [Tetradesmus obliquus]
MGKSTVSAFFKQQGVPVLCADEVVHKLYSAGGAAVAPVGAAFPSAVVDGAIDRAALSKCVVGNEAAMKQLEGIVHPLVEQERKQFIAEHAAAGSPLLLFDIPLLFETQAQQGLDAVAVVSAPAEQQRQRVMARPGMTADKLEAILARQVPDAEKRRLADFMPLRMNGPCSSTSHSTHRALGKQQVLAFSRCSGPTVPRRSVVAYGGPDIITSGEEEAADPFAWKIKKSWKASDGSNHVGSTLAGMAPRPFPGPPPSSGPPLRVLPIGGLGEIGMNCMLVGVKDRYILIDAGLLFPDFQDFGMQKILPDVSLLAQWRDKIEAVVITHGHEDHIGALPWVIPALDPATPVYAGSFVMQLVARRLQEYNLYNPDRFKVIEMLKEYEMGPFQVTPLRVTHSIPDCCGLILRSEHGSIVHTGDWKIDEDPVDGEAFDRTTFDLLSKEPISLMMSDSTNVLSPGRTPGEKIVQESLAQKVLDHQGKGRVVVTQFASNLHRLASVKAAADAAGRGICFIGTSLNTYLEAAYRDGRAPLSPSELIKPDQLPHMDPNKVLIVTTGSQAEPRAQLSLASRSASNNLKISPQDLILYSAKVIPGNETKVSEMLNSLALQGARVVAGRADNLHVSGHAYQGELEEVLRFVKPQHFLPVHGEYSFLVEHARLAKERAGVLFTEVIKNGQMLGVHERRNRNTISTGSMAAATVKAEAAAAAAAAEAEQGTAQDEPRSGISVIGEVDLLRLFNDGGKGTGTATEMALAERETLAFEGVIVVAVDVIRPKAAMSSGGWAGAAGGAAAAAAGGLSCKARLTTRAMWTDQGKLLDTLHQAVNSAVSKLPGDASLGLVERNVTDACMRASRWFNNRKPEVIVVAYEHDPRSAVMVLPEGVDVPAYKNNPRQNPDAASSGSDLAYD